MPSATSTLQLFLCNSDPLAVLLKHGYANENTTFIIITMVYRPALHFVHYFFRINNWFLESPVSLHSFLKRGCAWFIYFLLAPACYYWLIHSRSVPSLPRCFGLTLISLSVLTLISLSVLTLISLSGLTLISLFWTDPRLNVWPDPHFNVWPDPHLNVWPDPHLIV